MHFNKILIIFIILDYSISSYLIYPFKTRKSKVNDTDKNLTLLFRSILDNNIYINLEVGDPKQIIDVFLRIDICEFYFSKKNKADLNPYYLKPIMYDVNSDLNNFFDKDKSNTLEISNKYAHNSKWVNHKGNYSSDIFHLKENNEINQQRISFGLYNATLGNMPGILGLSLPYFKDDKTYNFIEQLKLNDSINNYFWMINYTSDNEGNIIIGEQPHILDPKNFKQKNLFTSQPFLYTTMRQWGLRFDDILFNNSNFRPDREWYFSYEYNYIGATDKFEKELDKYFNESILNGTCFKEIIKYSYSPHRFYYCNKDKYKENIKYFPHLKFPHSELNYTFELNYKDLFIEKDDKFILMVFFDGFPMYWQLGKPFLRKYSFLMNQDAKTVGFYHKEENENNNINENNSNHTALKIIIIILGVGILLILGIFIGKYYFKDKKRKNIIEDDYEYNSKKDDILQKNEEGQIN